MIYYKYPNRFDILSILPVILMRWICLSLWNQNKLNIMFCQANVLSCFKEKESQEWRRNDVGWGISSQHRHHFLPLGSLKQYTSSGLPTLSQPHYTSTLFLSVACKKCLKCGAWSAWIFSHSYGVCVDTACVFLAVHIGSLLLCVWLMWLDQEARFAFSQYAFCTNYTIDIQYQ